MTCEFSSWIQTRGKQQAFIMLSCRNSSSNSNVSPVSDDLKMNYVIGHHVGPVARPLYWSSLCVVDSVYCDLQLHPAAHCAVWLTVFVFQRKNTSTSMFLQKGKVLSVPAIVVIWHLRFDPVLHYYMYCLYPTGLDGCYLFLLQYMM